MLVLWSSPARTRRKHVHRHGGLDVVLSVGDAHGVTRALCQDRKGGLPRTADALDAAFAASKAVDIRDRETLPDVRPG